MVHSYNGISFRNKKKWAIKPQRDMEESKCILLSERTQTEKVTYCMIPTMWHSGKGKAIETVERSVVAKG